MSGIMAILGELSGEGKSKHFPDDRVCIMISGK